MSAIKEIKINISTKECNIKTKSESLVAHSLWRRVVVALFFRLAGVVLLCLLVSHFLQDHLLLLQVLGKQSVKGGEVLLRLLNGDRRGGDGFRESLFARVLHVVLVSVVHSRRYWRDDCLVFLSPGARVLFRLTSFYRESEARQHLLF